MAAASNSQLTGSPVKLANFEQHVKELQLKDGKHSDKLRREFNEIQPSAQGQTEQTDENTNEASARDPHTDARLCDSTRIELFDTEEYGKSCCVDASRVLGLEKTPLIAAQMPTEATLPPFLQMLMEENVKVVVMLTEWMEGDGRCWFKYWPPGVRSRYARKRFGVRLDGEEQKKPESCVMRHLALWHPRVLGGTEHVVTQVQYTGWPSRGVPAVKDFERFFEMARSEVAHSPLGHHVVVHCGGGVGITGTFILLYVLIDKVTRGHKEVDVVGTVKELRLRNCAQPWMKMVQNLDQLKFVYDFMLYYMCRKEHILLLHPHDFDFDKPSVASEQSASAQPAG